MLKLDKQLPAEQFEVTVSQSPGGHRQAAAAPPEDAREGAQGPQQMFMYIYIYIHIYIYI